MPLGKALVLRQEDIDLEWMALESYCLRGFFFEGSCHDEMGVEDGVDPGLSYVPTCRYEPRALMQRGKAAEFPVGGELLGVGEVGQGDGNGGEAPLEVGPQPGVNIGHGADIGDLTEFSLAAWVYARSGGEADVGRLFVKGGGIGLQVWTTSTPLKLRCRVYYSTTAADSITDPILVKNEWHHVVVRYSESGDRKVHILVDGVEATYATQVASVGTRVGDSAADGWIGSDAAGVYGWDGFVTTFLLYNRVLTDREVNYLSQTLYTWRLPWLETLVFEPAGRVDVYRAPRGFPGWSAHGVVSIEFDGMSSTIHSAGKPVLDAFGVKGGVAIVTSEIGGPGKLGPGELHDFAACGWEIISQGVSGVDLAGISGAQLRAELGDSREALLWYGGARHFAWPVDLPHADARQVCAEYYESAGRGGQWEEYDQMIFGMGHLLVEDPGELAAYRDAVEDARYGGRYVTLVQRVVGPDQVAILENLLQYAKDLEVPVVTRSIGLEIVDVWPPIALHGGASVEARNFTGGSDAWWRWIEKGMGLPAGGYVVSFFAWKDEPYRGAPVDQEDVEPYLEDHEKCLVGESHYEHVVGGIYYCWTVFDAPAGILRVGAVVRAGRRVWISLPELEAL